MQKSCEMGVRAARYTGAKSGPRTARFTVQSPLEAAVDLAVRWSDFTAKSHTIGDAINAINYQGSSMAFPGTHTCIQNRKWTSGSLSPPNGFHRQRSRIPTAMEEARELSDLHTTHRRLRGVETKSRKETGAKTSKRMSPTAFLAVVGHPRHCPTTREVGSAHGGTWDACE